MHTRFKGNHKGKGINHIETSQLIFAQEKLSGFCTIDFIFFCYFK